MVQGPETEVIGHIVTSDFMALLNHQNREIVGLLGSGRTSLSKIGGILGYANYSAVSKRLAQIRRDADGSSGTDHERTAGRSRPRKPVSPLET